MPMRGGTMPPLRLLRTHRPYQVMPSRARTEVCAAMPLPSSAVRAVQRPCLTLPYSPVPVRGPRCLAIPVPCWALRSLALAYLCRATPLPCRRSRTARGSADAPHAIHGLAMPGPCRASRSLAAAKPCMTKRCSTLPEPLPSIRRSSLPMRDRAPPSLAFTVPYSTARSSALTLPNHAEPSPSIQGDAMPEPGHA